jgi:hypothetical protein
MDRRILLFVSVLIVLSIAGCRTTARSIRTDSASVPDGTYEVYEYRGERPQSYAVLFDIQDGRPVVMYHNYLTKSIGQDSPGEYIERFNYRIKGYKTYEIADPDSTVRAYLVISNFEYHSIVRTNNGEKIVVRVGPPFHGPVLDRGRRD